MEIAIKTLQQLIQIAIIQIKLSSSRFAQNTNVGNQQDLYKRYGLRSLSKNPKLDQEAHEELIGAQNTQIKSSQSLNQGRRTIGNRAPYEESKSTPLTPNRQDQFDRISHEDRSQNTDDQRLSQNLSPEKSQNQLMKTYLIPLFEKDVVNTSEENVSLYSSPKRHRNTKSTSQRHQMPNQNITEGPLTRYRQKSLAKNFKARGSPKLTKKFKSSQS